MAFINKFIHATNVRLTHPRITKGQIIFTAFLAFAAAGLFFFIDDPFHPGYPVTAFISGIFHLLIYLFFPYLRKKPAVSFTAVSMVNIVLLGCAIHFTGGIMSPFIFFFFLILISDAANGIENPINAITAISVYLAIAALEYFNVLKPIDLHLYELFEYPITAAVIIVSTVSFMALVGWSYRFILFNLRTSLENELAHKQSLMRQFAKLEAPSQIGLLVNKIIHDLRGPLGAVSAFIRILKSEPGLSEESKEDCSVMASEMDRMSKMFDQLIDYSRPVKIKKENLSPTEVIETVLAVLSFYPGANSIVFKNNFMTNGTTYVDGYKDALQQVFFNVYKNSVEALSQSHDKKIIETQILLKENEILIEISDNGPGFPPELINKGGLESFSTKEKGGGIGLIICNEIVRSMDGRFTISQKTPQGARVQVCLPSLSS